MSFWEGTTFPCPKEHGGWTNMARQNVRKQRMKCGIIMPISEQAYSGLEYSCAYWASLRQFLCDAIKFAGFEPQPMWEDSSESSITPRIVGNIKSCPLALCVISACNPNVMIELGMRLFADKPILVVYDESIRRLPFDINDLEAYKIPYRPLYADYSHIKDEIKKRLCQMAQPDYKTYLNRYKDQSALAQKTNGKTSESQRLDGDMQIERRLSACEDVVAQCRGDETRTLQGQRISIIGPTFPLGPTGNVGDGTTIN